MPPNTPRFRHLLARAQPDPVPARHTCRDRQPPGALPLRTGARICERGPASPKRSPMPQVVRPAWRMGFGEDGCSGATRRLAPVLTWRLVRARWTFTRSGSPRPSVPKYALDPWVTARYSGSRQRAVILAGGCAKLVMVGMEGLLVVARPGRRNRAAYSHSLAHRGRCAALV